MTKHYSSLQHIINLQVIQLVVMIHTISVSRNGTLSIYFISFKLFWIHA